MIYQCNAHESNRNWENTTLKIIGGGELSQRPQLRDPCRSYGAFIGNYKRICKFYNFSYCVRIVTRVALQR